MRNKRKLMLEQLDIRVLPFIGTKEVIIPNRGWIHNIRTSLNMTMAQLGRKLNVTRQGIKRIEQSEENGTISLRRLDKVAKAMGLQMVYCIIPKEESFENFVHLKAEKLARKIVFMTNKNMELEDQGIGDLKINKAISDLTEEIKVEMKKSLWE